MHLSGLADAVLADPILAEAMADARGGGVPALDLTGPEALRPFVVAAFTNEEGVRFMPDMMGSLVHAGGLALDAALDAGDLPLAFLVHGGEAALGFRRGDLISSHVKGSSRHAGDAWPPVPGG